MAVAEWFFLRGRTENGPFTLGQIQSYFSSGTITEETYLWRPGCTDWFPLAAFEEFTALLPPPVAPADTRYSDELRVESPSRGAVQNEAPALVNPRQWMDEAPHPWRRYFARYLDYFLWCMALMVLLSIGLASVHEEMFLQFVGMLEGPGGPLVATVIGIVLAVIANAILIGLTGGNLGKWLFGVCVLDESDRPIGIVRAFKREGRVLFFGLGLGIPVVTLVTMIIAYQKLKKDGVTSWDEALAVRVVHRKTGVVQYIGYIVGLVLILGLFGVILWSERLS